MAQASTSSLELITSDVDMVLDLEAALDVLGVGLPGPRSEAPRTRGLRQR